MLTYLWIALGGALGSVTRYGIAEYLVARHSAPPPYAILLINATGSFLIGLCAALTDPGSRWHASLNFRLFFMVGVCGGYTTFSSFSLQTFDLARSGAIPLAGLNVLASVAFCLLAVWLGYRLGAAGR